MLFLNVENISEENLQLIEDEKHFLIKNSEIFKKKKQTLLNFMQNFANSVEIVDINSASSVLSSLENLKNSMDLCNSNISNTDICINSLDNVIFSIKNNSHDLINILNSFNHDYSELTKIILDNSLRIEKTLCDISEISEIKFYKQNSTVSQTSDSTITQEIPVTTEKNISEDTITSETPVKSEVTVDESQNSTTLENSVQNIKEEVITKPEKASDTENPNQKDYHENTLIVSESSGKVTLPYKISKVEEYYKSHQNKYSSVDNVIEKEYTLPISSFKNPFISRFREAYKLIREKEKGTISDGFELGLELMFNNNLHPAIISACSNLDELDIYLDYLDSGETNKFNCFKVIFDLPPATVKRKNEF